ncbi:hypothetical protein BFJ69_g7656 [Fusarium oxysporum]|uniref:Zn(2)-C6 fungal-type domain-containing protein n=1 Tax=Fusarium oxysporum TaxID=5507 RepID=A0A420N5K0_FUSOX|nr:hypothetical protein BFJ69_g7656 [Fusarium oxysporum]
MDKGTRRNILKTGYPRQRAVAACLTCRERKRKCDNLRPVCSSCERIGARCEYTRQDASSFDPASLQILEQLSVIEGLVRGIQPSTSFDFPTAAAISGHQEQQNSPTDAHPLQNDLGPDTEPIVPSLNLEASRGSNTDRLLQWPIFDKVLSSLPRFKFFDSNSQEVFTYLDDAVRQTDAPGAHLSLTSGSGSVNISTDKSDIQQLVDSFFQRVNIKNPILSRQEVEEYCHQYYENGPQFNLETGLVLLICALGAVADEFNPLDMGQSPVSSFQTPSRLERLKLGHCYFTASEKRLGAAISRVDTLSIQCLCLAGIYHMYLIRPVQALRLFHAAGSSLQILLSTNSQYSVGGTSQLISSLFWTCSKSESEILAEMPLGIPALRDPPSQDSYPPPQQITRDKSNKWASSEEDSWFFLLSEIALRRITDQVAEIVTKYIDSKIRYQQGQRIEDLVPIVAEFESQVETFRQLLPEAIRFHDVPEPASTEWQQYSRGRYYRVLELMHRPFVFTAIHEPSCSPAVQALAKKGLENGLKYLQHSQASHRHHGLWLQLRNQLRIASLLLAASTIPHLTMPDGWYGGISKTLATLDYWSWEFPSCKSYTDVILALSASSSGTMEERTPMSY